MYASILHYVRSLRSSRLVGVGLASTLAVVVGGVGCDQASPLCRTGSGTFTARLKQTAGPTDPDTSKCGGWKTELFFVNSYNDMGEDGKPNLEKVSGGIAPARLADAIDAAEHALGTPATQKVDSDPNHYHYAWGHFTSSEAQGDFCSINFERQPLQDIPATPELERTLKDTKNTPNDKCDDTVSEPGQDAVDATSYKYEFSNWKLLFTAAHPGTQFAVHFKVEVTSGGTTETCEYDAHAALFGNRQSCDKGDGTALPEACLPDGNPAIKQVARPAKKAGETCDPATGSYLPTAGYVEDAGLSNGSGVDPSYPIVCDPVELLCLLEDRPFPALK